MSINCKRFTHDLLAETIAHRFGLVHGKDFVVAHKINSDGTQADDPFIATWNTTSVPEPDITTLTAHFRSNRDAIRGRLMRRVRDSMLTYSDVKVMVPDDAPDAVKAKAAEWKDYRQKLRDITSDPGFPIEVKWPDVPA